MGADQGEGLVVSSLEVRYGDFVALKDVSIRLGNEEFVVVLGANAAGKSTLLQSIAGLVPVHSGDIQLNGESMNRLATSRRLERGVVYVPEGRQIFPFLTVEENLRAGAWTKSRRPHTDEGLARVYELMPQLRNRRKQLGGTLSGGEQQMLAIGRGIMSGPRLLLIDEPSLGLSPIWMSTVFGVIEEVAGQGTAVLMVEQNVVLALELADRAYVLASGQCVREGRAEELQGDDELRRAYMGI